MKPNLYYFPPGHLLWDGCQPECVLRVRRKVRRKYVLRRSGYHFGMFLIAAGVWVAALLLCALPDILMQL